MTKDAQRMAQDLYLRFNQHVRPSNGDPINWPILEFLFATVFLAGQDRESDYKARMQFLEQWDGAGNPYTEFKKYEDSLPPF